MLDRFSLFLNSGSSDLRMVSFGNTARCFLIVALRNLTIRFSKVGKTWQYGINQHLAEGLNSRDSESLEEDLSVWDLVFYLSDEAYLYRSPVFLVRQNLFSADRELDR